MATSCCRTKTPSRIPAGDPKAACARYRAFLNELPDSGVFTDRVECRSPRAHNELASRRENDGEAVFPPSFSGRLSLPAESGCPDSRALQSHRLKATGGLGVSVR